MKLDPLTLAWLAGLIEAEGHISLALPSHRNHLYRPQISVQMTDEDVVVRAADIFGTQHNAVSPFKAHWKTMYVARLRGVKAYELLKLIYPFMGKRRQEKITYVLENFIHLPEQIGSNNKNSKLTETEVIQIKSRLRQGETAKSIAQDFGVTHYNIWAISEGKTWRHVSADGAVLPVTTQKEVTVHNSGASEDEIKLYWLAGLSEGEGSFMAGPPSAPNSPRISIPMTDEDVIARVATLCEIKYSTIKPRNENHKIVYRVMIKGSRAIELMSKLYPLMGMRRKQQIDRALASYKSKSAINVT